MSLCIRNSNSKDSMCRKSCSEVTYLCFTSIQMNMNSEDIFKFIEIVHGAELLWNISCKSYKDTQRRNDLWTEIGSKFNVSGKEAYETFRRLREKYRREHEKENAANRSGAGLSAAPKWIYMDHLRFLDETYKKRRVTNSALWTMKQQLTQPELVTSQTPGTTNALSQMAIGRMSETQCGNMSQTPESITTRPVTAAECILPAPSSPVQAASPPISPLPIPSDIYRPSPSPDSNQSTSSSFQQQSRMRVRSIEQIMAHNTRELINAMNAAPAPKPFDSVVELVRDTLTTLDSEKCKSFEKELMQLVCRYRYEE